MAPAAPGGGSNEGGGGPGPPPPWRCFPRRAPHTPGAAPAPLAVITGTGTGYATAGAGRAAGRDQLRRKPGGLRLGTPSLPSTAGVPLPRSGRPKTSEAVTAALRKPAGISAGSAVPPARGRFACCERGRPVRGGPVCSRAAPGEAQADGVLEIIWNTEGKKKKQKPCDLFRGRNLKMSHQRLECRAGLWSGSRVCRDWGGSRADRF
ncbi:unnamed protein product [Coccothraustes coccothraustes]